MCLFLFASFRTTKKTSYTFITQPRWNVGQVVPLDFKSRCRVGFGQALRRRIQWKIIFRTDEILTKEPGKVVTILSNRKINDSWFVFP